MLSLQRNVLVRINPSDAYTIEMTEEYLRLCYGMPGPESAFQVTIYDRRPATVNLLGRQAALGSPKWQAELKRAINQPAYIILLPGEGIHIELIPLNSRLPALDGALVQQRGANIRITHSPSQTWACEIPGQNNQRIIFALTHIAKSFQLSIPENANSRELDLRSSRLRLLGYHEQDPPPNGEHNHPVVNNWLH